MRMVRILYNKSSLENIELERTDDKDTALEKISQECAYTMAESEENNWNFYLYKSQRAISGSVRRLLLEEIPLMAALLSDHSGSGAGFFQNFYKKDRRTYQKYGPGEPWKQRGYSQQ